MKTHLVKLGSLAALMAGVLAIAGDAGAKEMSGWKVEGSGTGIVPGKTYSLFNLDQKEYLRYEDRWGGNYGWSKTANNGMKVARKDGSTGPIKCGEIFALFNQKEWAIYGKQDVGINLTSRTKLDQDSYYQWKFAGCKEGEIIQLNQPVTLVNTVEKDSLVGCKRTLGVNLCWADDIATVAGKNYRKADVPR